jgi:hypothetical protein
MVEKRKSIIPVEVKRGGYLLGSLKRTVAKKPAALYSHGLPSPAYRGVRMRVWGKWVTEIRDPVTKTRIWLGSFATAEMAARAYDAAVVCLKGPSAPEMNFPGSVPSFVIPQSGSGKSPKEIQAVALAAATASVPAAAPLAIATNDPAAAASSDATMNVASAMASNVENWINEEFGELDAALDEDVPDFCQEWLEQCTEDDDAADDPSVHHNVELWSFP